MEQSAKQPVKRPMERWMEKLMKKHALNPQDIETLLSVGERRQFAAGTTIVRMGEVDEHIYLLTSGVWREYCFRDGEEATIWFSVAGEITFSPWGYVAGQPSPLFLESITDSEAIAIARSTLNELFATSLNMANLGRKIIENFTILYERWHIQMWQQNALDHYLRLMEEYPEVVQNIPLKYVASYLGITVQSLSRIRASIGSAEETPPFRR